MSNNHILPAPHPPLAYEETTATTSSYCTNDKEKNKAIIIAEGQGVRILGLTSRTR